MKYIYVSVLVAALVSAVSLPAAATAATTGLLPDLRTVIPTQMQVVNAHQREVLRFTNGVANTGKGHLRVRPQFPSNDPSQPQAAIQQILDASGNVVEEHAVSMFDFHPEHNHWHIDDVALFQVRKGTLSGPVVGSGVKITSCLIDWYKLDGNSPNNQRNYSECNAAFQGITPGWVDQYHMSLEGQSIDITGAKPGKYYLVSIANPDRTFIESNLSNNTEWVSFNLTRDSKGNPKITITGHSPCENAGMCGTNSPNR